MVAARARAREVPLLGMVRGQCARAAAYRRHSLRSVVFRYSMLALYVARRKRRPSDARQSARVAAWRVRGNGVGSGRGSCWAGGWEGGRAGPAYHQSPRSSLLARAPARADALSTRA